MGATAGVLEPSTMRESTRTTRTCGGGRRREGATSPSVDFPAALNCTSVILDGLHPTLGAAMCLILGHAVTAVRAWRRTYAPLTLSLRAHPGPPTAADTGRPRTHRRPRPSHRKDAPAGLPGRDGLKRGECVRTCLFPCDGERSGRTWACGGGGVGLETRYCEHEAAVRGVLRWGPARKRGRMGRGRVCRREGRDELSSSVPSPHHLPVTSPFALVAVDACCMFVLV